MTFALHVKRPPAKSEVVKRPLLKAFFVSATVAAMVFFATSKLGNEPSLSILEWRTQVTDLNGVLEQDSVPIGYWSKLVSVLKNAPLLPEDDYSVDPDPIV